MASLNTNNALQNPKYRSDVFVFLALPINFQPGTLTSVIDFHFLVLSWAIHKNTYTHRSTHLKNVYLLLIRVLRTFFPPHGIEKRARRRFLPHVSCRTSSRFGSRLRTVRTVCPRAPGLATRSELAGYFPFRFVSVASRANTIAVVRVVPVRRWKSPDSAGHSSAGWCGKLAMAECPDGPERWLSETRTRGVRWIRARAS